MEVVGPTAITGIHSEHRWQGKPAAERWAHDRCWHGDCSVGSLVPGTRHSLKEPHSRVPQE